MAHFLLSMHGFRLVILFSSTASALHSTRGKLGNHTTESEPKSGRTWMICEGPQFRPPSDEQVLAGVKAASDMRCTQELGFRELCCLDYSKLDSEALMPHRGAMMLDLAQTTVDPSTAEETVDAEENSTTNNFLSLSKSAGKGRKLRHRDTKLMFENDAGV